MLDSANTPHIISVSELNRLARDVLEQSFPLFWVSGEISNFTRAASGHWYFSLKDESAQVSCVMFRGRNSYLDWSPKEGDKVEARALVTLYEARGSFQLTIEFLQRAGAGALFEAFEKLKTKLQQEGLFDAAFKQAIPAHPKQIGIVTSSDAAALHDVLTTLRRRMPNIPVVIYPTPVQGKGASTQIANAINSAHQRNECDVLIICRGGGSMEDLWQFNEEIVARAIANCKIPTISGVGHETDFTICDFVADVRAPTPTAAAELASPSRESLRNSRIDSVSVVLNDYPTSVYAVLGLEMLTNVRIIQTAPGAQIDKTLLVHGITHDIRPGRWVTTFQTVEPVITGFILGSSYTGVLGESALGPY